MTIAQPTTAPRPYEEEWLEREFVGYGFTKPDPQWPGGGKICVSFVIQYNMGAESSVEDGDPRSCSDYLEIPKNAAQPNRMEAPESMYEFGGREGVARLISLFKKYEFPVTWNIFTQALAKAPYWVKPLVESGVELSLGGHKYRDNFYVGPVEEEALLRKSMDVLQELTADATLPKGWLVDRRSNLSVKLYSTLHASRSLPLAYSSDSCADDLPYWVPSPARSATGEDPGLLMIPFSYDCSDIRFNARGSGWASPKDYWLHLKDTFDCLYEEGEVGEAKMMTVLLHPHIIGRAGRLWWFEHFLQYISSKEGVWVARRQDIASHFSKRFPYDPKTAFGQTEVAPCEQIKIPA